MSRTVLLLILVCDDPLRKVSHVFRASAAGSNTSRTKFLRASNGVGLSVVSAAEFQLKRHFSTLRRVNYLGRFVFWHRGENHIEMRKFSSRIG